MPRTGRDNRFHYWQPVTTIPTPTRVSQHQPGTTGGPIPHTTATRSRHSSGSDSTQSGPGVQPGPSHQAAGTSSVEEAYASHRTLHA
ncbi:hypothetical protein PENNAL_c0029G04451 [Penicillium nalgiovense]|uniref:Uncharacterized protein n=1 Tax=Penicillium nalgiovense TaxID=60175 RepID=A0A1V6Y9B1_PENNA|nr:hypothetical protein PENNAL_c0029G04451 [Penicillium nalgiovense]